MTKRQRQVLPVLFLIATAYCASVGAGDKLVVRAEDLLTNSLTVFNEAYTYHDGDAAKGIVGHSTEESPAVYKTFERVRVAFPKAWAALDKAKRDYQANRALGTSSLDAAVKALTDLLAELTPLIPVKIKAQIHLLTMQYGGA